MFRKSVKRWGRPVTAQAVYDAYQVVSAQLELTKDLPILICKKIASPMILGLLNPVILLPQEEFSTDELHMILTHELIHYRRRDVWYKLLLFLANAVHWFNPLAYCMVQAANENLELCCDTLVIGNRGKDFRYRYSDTLLSVMSVGRSRSTVFSTYLYSGTTAVKERFVNVLNEHKKSTGVFALTTAVLVAFSAATCITYSSPGDFFTATVLQTEETGWTVTTEDGQSIFVALAASDGTTAAITSGTVVRITYRQTVIGKLPHQVLADSIEVLR